MDVEAEIVKLQERFTALETTPKSTGEEELESLKTEFEAYKVKLDKCGIRLDTEPSAG